jgi:small subunit ribosomal protein S8
MSLSDPIADMLTRIRNAHMAGMEVVEMPHSRLKGEITRVLKKEGFITDYVVEGGGKRLLRIYLKYDREQEPAIRGVRRESRPGLRRYANAAEIPKVLGGMGTAVLSTSAGVLTDKEARARNIGGEVLCSVW